jgi:hypothetical protein
MTNLAIIPTQAAVEAAWERYRALAKEAIDNPDLMADRLHCEAMIQAHEQFRQAFLSQR